jgi:hypothetical protein
MKTTSTAVLFFLRIVQSSSKTVPLFPTSNSGLLCPETQKLYFQYHGYCTNSVLNYQTIHIFVSILPSLEIVLSFSPNSVVAAAFTTCISLLFISFLVFSCYKDLSLAKKQDDVVYCTLDHAHILSIVLILPAMDHHICLLACVPFPVPKINL